MNELEQKITDMLNDLRVYLQNDGGDLEIVDFANGGKTVRLKLKGACGGCPHATMTIKDGLEACLRENIDPEITVERVL